MSQSQPTKHDYKLIQRALNETMGVELVVDGAIGRASLNVISKYQEQNGLAVTSQLDMDTFAQLYAYAQTRFVTVEQIAKTAVEYNFSPASLLAFWEVESNGMGFLADGRTVILFERHKFYQYVSERLGKAQAEAWRKSHPDLCHPVWDPAYYGIKGGEWDRLNRACQLDATCALLSASWGLFQLMGFNYAMAGFQDVQSMVGAFQTCEQNQLIGACRFISAQPALMTSMKTRNWASVARIYNGPRYAENSYDTKLKNSFDKWSKTTF